MAEQRSIEPPPVGSFVGRSLEILSPANQRALTFDELFRIQEEARQYADIRETMTGRDYEVRAADAFRNSSPEGLRSLLFSIMQQSLIDKRYNNMPQNNVAADRVTDHALIDYHVRQLHAAHGRLSERDARLRTLQTEYISRLMRQYVLMLTQFAENSEEERAIRTNIESLTHRMQENVGRMTALDFERQIEATYTREAAKTLSQLKSRRTIPATIPAPYRWENGVLVATAAAPGQTPEPAADIAKPLPAETYAPVKNPQEIAAAALLAQAKMEAGRAVPDYDGTLRQAVRAEQIEWEVARTAAREVLQDTPGAPLKADILSRVTEHKVREAFAEKPTLSRSETTALLRQSALIAQASLLFGADETPEDLLSTPGFFGKIAKTPQQKIAAVAIDNWISLSGDPKAERARIVGSAFRKGLDGLLGQPSKLTDALGKAAVDNDEFRLMLQNSKMVFDRQGSGAGGIAQGASGLMGDMAGSLFGAHFADASLTYLAAAEGKRIVSKTGSIDVESLRDFQIREQHLRMGIAQPTNAAEALFVLTLMSADDKALPGAPEGMKSAIPEFLSAVKAQHGDSAFYAMGSLPEEYGFGFRDQIMLTLLADSPEFFQRFFVFQQQSSGKWSIRWSSTAFASARQQLVRRIGMKLAPMLGIASGKATGLIASALGIATGPVGWITRGVLFLASFVRGLFNARAVDALMEGRSLPKNSLAWVLLFTLIIGVIMLGGYSEELVKTNTLAINADVGGGEEPIVCLRDDPNDPTRCIVRINGQEVSLPKELVEEMGRNYLNPGVDCTQTPDNPACNFTPCDPASDPAGCRNPLNCPGVCISQGPAPVSGYTHRDYNENAVDMACRPALDTFTVTAGHAGIVTFTGRLGGYGNAIRLRSLDNSYETIYAHLAAFNVSEGQQVTAGAAIGSMDNTGNSTGTHLHYERRDGPDFGSDGIESVDVRQMLPALPSC